LLVVGGGGVTHIITRADFAGVAGTAVVLACLTVLDAEMDRFIQADLNRVRDLMGSLTTKQIEDAEANRRRASRQDAGLTLASYVGFAVRLRAMAEQHWVEGFAVEESDLDMMIRVRNSAAHGEEFSNPSESLVVLKMALNLVDSIPGTHGVARLAE
jgi:hypothetical protein